LCEIIGKRERGIDKKDQGVIFFKRSEDDFRINKITKFVKIYY